MAQWCSKSRPRPPERDLGELAEVGLAQNADCVTVRYQGLSLAVLRALVVPHQALDFLVSDDEKRSPLCHVLVDLAPD